MNANTSMRATARWVVALTGIGSLMAALDTVVVSTALSTIRLDLGASVEQLEWAVAGTNSMMRELGGRVRDRDRRPGAARPPPRGRRAGSAACAGGHAMRHVMVRHKVKPDRTVTPSRFGHLELHTGDLPRASARRGGAA